MAMYEMVIYGMKQDGMVWLLTLEYGMSWYKMLQYGMIKLVIMWHCTVSYGIHSVAG